LKRPSFQFYPGDWLKDTALRACCLAARGLWMDMLSFMHQGTPYGYLTLPSVVDDGGKDILRPILPGTLARMVGGTAEEVDRLLSELEAAGVFSRSAEGIIFSRRMVSDEKLRELRASGGILSLGNPNVPQPKNNRKDTLEGSFRGSPSSSSSSKISSSEQKTSSDPVSVASSKRPTTGPSLEASRLAALLKSEILRNNANHRITPAQERQWAAIADRMLRIDQRSAEQTGELIRWAQRDEFWRANILSMNAVREKFDQLVLKRQNTNGFSSRKTSALTGDAVANTLALLAGGVQ
jgi:hypothetical protein